MNHESSEQHLRDLFRRVRERDSRDAPPFPVLLNRPYQPKPAVRGRSLVLGLSGAAIGVSLLLFVLFSHRLSSGDEEFDMSIRMAGPLSRWTAPTDVLLQPPDPGLIRGVPKLGETFYQMKIDIE